MTLLVGITNERGAWLASDRRIVDFDYKPMAQANQKHVLAHTGAGVAAIASCGIDWHRGGGRMFITSDWLPEVTRDCASMDEIIERIVSAADDVLAKPLYRMQERLAFLGVAVERGTPYLFSIANSSDGLNCIDRFEVQAWAGAAMATLGGWHRIAEDDIHLLRSLKREPAADMPEALAGVIRRTACELISEDSAVTAITPDGQALTRVFGASLALAA